MPALFIFALVLSGPWAAPPNPCTNGSFEELAPSGFPLDWERVGQTVEVVPDAHSGQRALRLLRTPDTAESETGLNRAWKAHSGERGAMIDRLKGGIEFWYKALSAADGTKLTVQAIPMNAEPIEQTESPRTIFTVPAAHVADGQWHQARLKYDFTGDPKVKWVHFGARILGTSGEMLLDDFAYVETVGPLLRISRLRLDEDPKKPGERCTLSALIENVGDRVAEGVQAAIALPQGLAVGAAKLALGRIEADKNAKVAWTVAGMRKSACAIEFCASSGSERTTVVLRVAPRLVIESFGPAEPVTGHLAPFWMECVIRNAGNATAIEPRATFGFPENMCPSDDGDAPVDIPTVTPRYATVGVQALPPGQRVVLKSRFRGLGIVIGGALLGTLRLGAANAQEEVADHSDVIVHSLDTLPRPSGRLRAAVRESLSILEDKQVRLACHRTHDDSYMVELWAKAREGWRRIALTTGQSTFAAMTPAWDAGRPATSWIRAMEPHAAQTGETARLWFTWPEWPIKIPNLPEQPNCQGTCTFSLGEQGRVITTGYDLKCEGAGGLGAFKGPMLYVLDRDEALFPGIEWLVEDELSSSTLDIAAEHPDRKRFVVHPNMVTIPAIGVHGRHGTVGLLWDVHQKWDGQRDRPSVIFASPDRLNNQRAHLMGLFLPNVPEFVEPNAQVASKPYPMKPTQPLHLQCLIFADGEAKDALAAVDEWIRIYGLPEPQPLPKRSDQSDQSDPSDRSYESEIQFSMQAYLKSLWVPETKEWWTSKGGGPIMSKKGRPHDFVADLLFGSMVSPDEAVRKQCRERAEEVAALLKTEPRLDAMRFPGRFDLAIANPAHAAGLLATMGDDGAWRFDADQEGKGPFVGADYHELGPDNAVEVGTCANKAYQILRYARIAGDREAYERMQKTLRLMETFRVPRAAQVWEVPVHTPDLLAAADAVDAYLEAYRFSGDERWLRDAVTWARRGIPFIYLWNPPDKPWLLGASIPVFGASWFTCSWFGRPVQWNGLRYATALLKLAEYDQSKDWRRLAELIIRSAILQQDPQGENVALWPDNISAIDGTKCPWVFAPRQIIQNILLLNGRDEEPQTTILTHKAFLTPIRRIHVSATAKVSEAAWDGDSLAFRAAYPQGEEGTVLVANVARPTTVLLDGKPIAERGEVEKGAEPGWRYDEPIAYLSIRIANVEQASCLLAGGTPAPPREPQANGLKAALQTKTVRIEGARFRQVDRLPTLAERLDFSFDRSAEGWTAAHDIAGLAVRGGALCGTAIAPDPYIVRGLVRAKGDDCPVLLIRMRVTAGRAAQFFWCTEASAAFGEEKSLHFPLIADGQFHDYRLEVGKHPQWAGQTVTALRLDPGDAPGEFAVDFIRGVTP